MMLKRLVLLLAIAFLPDYQVLGQHPNQVARKGNELYLSGKYKEAEASYRKSLEKKKTLQEANYNLGNTLLKQGKTTDATEVYKGTIASESDKRLKQKAWHNLGTMQLKEKNWEEGAKSFAEALKLNPADEDSRYNLAYAKAMMKQVQQNKQDKDKKDDKKKDQNEPKENDQKKNEGNDKKENKDNKEENENDESAGKDKKQEQQMSKEDAERLLNALASKEKDLQKKMNKKKLASRAAAAQIEKDW